MGSHIVTCHPSQVNVHRLNQNIRLTYTADEWKAELTFVLAVNGNGLSISIQDACTVQ